MDVWVLWHRYGDESGAHIERVYLDEERAKADYELLGKTATGTEWYLDQKPVTGPT